MKYLAIIIGFIIALWTTVFNGNTAETGFFAAIDFLWVWYWIWSVVLGVIYLLVSLSIMGAGVSATQGLQKLGGFAVGAGVSLFIWIQFAIKRGLLLGGVYLLTISGGDEVSFSEFDTTKLIFGLIMVLVGTLIFNSSESSSE